MKNNILGICLFSISLFACKTEIEQNTPESNVWELEIVDSIQVDYLGRIWSADFKNGYGYLKDISTNSLVKFDTLGK
ncbi:MAG TPA: hypothetical protein DCY95_16025, partial [Algoriphagus sp.]|nr:hypothetical protein [Algoriphagus sp.]